MRSFGDSSTAGALGFEGVLRLALLDEPFESPCEPMVAVGDAVRPVVSCSASSHDSSVLASHVQVMGGNPCASA